jgi:predicted RNA binding protein with dsRBD fold (UPF0201 family)
MDYVELLTMWLIVKFFKLEEEVARELKIKKSSLKRQMNRIEAYYKGRSVQTRSGLKRGQEYLEAMRKVLERRIGQPIFTHTIYTHRQVAFQTIQDLLKYREPIAHISTIRYEEGLEFPWMLYIAIDSAAI